MVALRLWPSVSRMCKGGVGACRSVSGLVSFCFAWGSINPMGLWCLAVKTPVFSLFSSAQQLFCQPFGIGVVAKCTCWPVRGGWHPPFSVGLSFSLPPPHTGARERQCQLDKGMQHRTTVHVYLLRLWSVNACGLGS